MSIRKHFLIGVVGAALAWSPAPADAQQGLDRAAVARAEADAVGAATRGKAVGRPAGLPKGAGRRFDDRTLPPGLGRTRQASAPAPDPAPDPEPDPDPDDWCEVVVVVVNGIPMLQDCEGNLFPGGG